MELVFSVGLAISLVLPGLAAVGEQNPSKAPLETAFYDAASLLKDRSSTSLLIRGNPKAKITLLEYGDFDCPYTARMHPVVIQLLKDHPDTVRLVFKMKPLLFHPEALPAALRWAAVILQAPEKGWLYFDALFEGKLAGRLGAEYYREIEQRLGIDSAALAALIASGAPAALVSRSSEEFDRRGLEGTPTFFVNDQEVPPAYEFLDYEIRKLEETSRP